MNNMEVTKTPKGGKAKRLVEGVDYTTSGKEISLNVPIAPDTVILAGSRAEPGTWVTAPNCNRTSDLSLKYPDTPDKCFSMPSNIHVATSVGVTHYHILIAGEYFSITFRKDTPLYYLWQWVSEKHQDQVRKDGTPYIFHIIEVAAITETLLGNDGAVAVALCHDLFEDTDVYWSKLYVKLNEFGFAPLVSCGIADDVLSLTDDGGTLPREVRKAKYATKVAKSSERAQSVKCADIISNFADVSCLDPKFLSLYVKEKQHILPLLDKAEPRLWRLANKLVQNANGTPHQILVINQPDPSMNGIKYVSDEAYGFLNENIEK